MSGVPGCRVLLDVQVLIRRCCAMGGTVIRGKLRTQCFFFTRKPHIEQLYSSPPHNILFWSMNFASIKLCTTSLCIQEVNKATVIWPPPFEFHHAWSHPRPAPLFFCRFPGCEKSCHSNGGLKRHAVIHQVHGQVTKIPALIPYANDDWDGTDNRNGDVHDHGPNLQVDEP